MNTQITKSQKNIDKLTRQQQKALHVYFNLLAETLNSAGLDMKIVLKPSIAINWSAKSVKEYLWRPIQNALLGKVSTTELLKKKDIDMVYDTLHRHLSEKFGEFSEFPSFPSVEANIFNETNRDNDN